MSTTENPAFFAMLPAPRVEPSERWVRVRFGGETVADSKHPLLVVQYGPGMLPTYFFPRDDVRLDLLEPGSERDGKRFWTVKVGEREAMSAAWEYIAPQDNLADLQDHITFKWHRMDAWFEEKEEVFVHARDPSKRVDVMPSSRHVRIVINGETVAESQRPSLLFETTLPTRFYLPPEDVRMDLLEPTQTKTQCPYKGIARYWSARVGGEVVEDIVWSYPDPIPENPKIKGLMCFYNERVDLYVDGELLPRPLSPWSR